MIGLKLDSFVKGFEYDIYSLVKAFYPKEEIRAENNDTAEFFVEVKYVQEDSRKSLVIALKEIGKKDTKNIRIVDISGIAGEEGRKKRKSCLKRALYDILSERTGMVLPWGTLTGIRPTKIAYGMLEAGKSDREIADFMKAEYLTGENKIALSIEIAKREQKILKKIDYRDGYSIYIGIPFCPTRCLYCSFPSYPLKVWEKRVDEYVEVLCQEIEAVSEIMKEKRLNTVYMGGGTPTTLSAAQTDRLLTKLRNSFNFKDNQEFTVEAGRPDSLTLEKLMVLQAHGVSRISVNPQTMRQKTLDLIGRQHTVEETVEAFWMARKCGFDNINMDLITGLPGETKEDMEYTMQELTKLKPDSLTVHSLAIKRASRLNELREQYADFISINNNEITAMMECYARGMGLMPYYLYRQKNMTGNLENVGYAAPDKAGIYNILIMEEKQTIIACGAGGISKRVYPDGKIERCENVKDVALYMEKINQMIERKQKLLERVYKTDF